MLRIGLQFPAGRYHATPWGRHVNEGDIEWPPSPWRLCRALLATGFTKAGWTEVPGPAADALAALAARPPIYHLPPAGAAHTRHYMPLYKDATTKVIDTFAYPGRDAVLVVEWEVALDSAQIEMLDTLLGRMSYLGRSESWIEAQRIERVPAGLTPCVPGDTPPGSDYERIGLLAPMTPADFAAWRERIFEHELARRHERKRHQAVIEGKKPPAAPGKRDRAALEAELPASLMDALGVDTTALQKAGWSQPPGSRWITYWRDRRALDAPRGPRARPGSSGPAHDFALLALTPDTQHSNTLPSMRDALWRCELLHKALVRESTKAHPAGHPSPCLTGCDDSERPLDGHAHATLIPLDLDNDQRIDHVAVHAPMGFDAAAVQALQRVRRTYAHKLPKIFVSLADLGRLRDLDRPAPALGRARIWVSQTPFVPPRYLKRGGKSALVGQVCAELASRGLPEPRAIEVEVVHAGVKTYVPATEFWPLWNRSAVWLRAQSAEPVETLDVVTLAPRWRHFRLARRDESRKPPVQAGFGLRLTFDEPIAGPVSLGYASHYGLGSFLPAEHDHRNTSP